MQGSSCGVIKRNKEVKKNAGEKPPERLTKGRRSLALWGGGRNKRNLTKKKEPYSKKDRLKRLKTSETGFQAIRGWGGRAERLRKEGALGELDLGKRT